MNHEKEYPFIVLLKEGAIRGTETAIPYYRDADPMAASHWRYIRKPMFLGIFYGTELQVKVVGADQAGTSIDNVTAIRLAPVVVEEDGCPKASFLLSAGNGDRMEDAFGQAVESAKANGERAWVSGIPKKYFEEQGLEVFPMDIWKVEDEKLYTSHLEQMGIRHAICKDCEDCRDGYCTEMNRKCLSVNTIPACHTGRHIFSLDYVGPKNILTSYALYSKMDLTNADIPDILEALRKDKDPRLEERESKKGYDPANWKLDDRWLRW